NHGNAVDLSYNGKSLKHAPKEVKDWVRENAPSYGMHIRMSWEPWHIEPIEKDGGKVYAGSGGGADAVTSTVVGRGGQVAPRSDLPSYQEITAYVDTIKDPDDREMTRKALNAEIDTRNKAFEENQKLIRTEAFNLIETEGLNPFTLPP